MVLLYPRSSPTDDEKDIAENYIEIRRSNIPNAGFGVFATQNIPCGRALGYYRGEIVTPEEHERRYAKKGYGEYSLLANDIDNPTEKVYIDGKHHYNWVSRVNASKGTGKKPNIQWDAYGHVTALRNIKKGEELLLNYGRSYWQGKKNGTRKIKLKK